MFVVVRRSALSCANERAHFKWSILLKQFPPGFKMINKALLNTIVIARVRIAFLVGGWSCSPKKARRSLVLSNWWDVLVSSDLLLKILYCTQCYLWCCTSSTKLCPSVVALCSTLAKLCPVKRYLAPFAEPFLKSHHLLHRIISLVLQFLERDTFWPAVLLVEFWLQDTLQLPPQWQYSYGCIGTCTPQSPGRFIYSATHYLQSVSPLM